MTSRSTRRVSMLVAIALLTTVALLVKTAAERWLATPVDAGHDAVAGRHDARADPVTSMGPA